MFPAILHNFRGTYDLVLDIKSIATVTLVNNLPLNRVDLLILFKTRKVIPNRININKPTVYQSGSHMQYLTVESMASTGFRHCKAKLVTSVFIFD